MWDVSCSEHFILPLDLNEAQPGWVYATNRPQSSKLGGPGYLTKRLNCPSQVLTLGTSVHHFDKKKNIVQNPENISNVALVSQS